MFKDLLSGGFSRPQPVYVPDVSNWQHQRKAYATRRSDSGEEGLGDFSSRLGETLSATAVTHLNQVLPWPVTYFFKLFCNKSWEFDLSAGQIKLTLIGFFDQF